MDLFIKVNCNLNKYTIMPDVVIDGYGYLLRFWSAIYRIVWINGKL